MMTDLLMLMIGVFLLQALFNFGQSCLLSFIGERLVADLRKKVFTHLQSLSLGFYDNQRVGELTSRLSNDVTAVQVGLTNNPQRGQCCATLEYSYSTRLRRRSTPRATRSSSRPSPG